MATGVWVLKFWQRDENACIHTVCVYYSSLSCTQEVVICKYQNEHKCFVYNEDVISISYMSKDKTKQLYKL